MDQVDIEKLREAANHLRLGLRALQGLTQEGMRELFLAEERYVLAGHEMPMHAAINGYAAMLVSYAESESLGIFCSPANPHTEEVCL
jgi:hypothetical protein